jgi:CDP-glucose 4,6-dehydratase
VRDYLYIDDAVSAYLTLAEQMEREDVCGQAFNFGANSPISALELVQRILDVCGAVHLVPDIRGAGKLANEIDEQYLDSRKAARVLGWVPTVSLEEGLRRTVEWYQTILARPVTVGVK